MALIVTSKTSAGRFVTDTSANGIGQHVYQVASEYDPSAPKPKAQPENLRILQGLVSKGGVGSNVQSGLSGVKGKYFEGTTSYSIRDPATGRLYNLGSDRGIELSKQYGREVGKQQASQRIVIKPQTPYLKVALPSNVVQEQRKEPLYSPASLKTTAKTFGGTASFGGGSSQRTGTPSYTAQPSTPVSSSKGFVETQKKRQDLNITKRGETLFQTGTSLTEESASLTKQANVARLTNAPTVVLTKKIKAFKEKVESYKKDKAKYLNDVGLAKDYSRLGKMYAGDLTYASGFGFPPVPYEYEVPPITKAVEGIEILGSKPEHFVESIPSFGFAKEKFGEWKAEEDEAKYMKGENEYRDLLPAAVSNLIPSTKPVRDFVSGTQKQVGETIEGFGKIVPSDVLGPTIEDMPLHVETTKELIREKGKDVLRAFGSQKPFEPSEELFKETKTAIEKEDWSKLIGVDSKSPLGVLFGVKPSVFEKTKGEVAGYGFEKGLKTAGGIVGALEVGASAGGLGFQMIGEPVIGSLPDEELKLGGGFGLSKGRFRRALGFAGEMAFFDALMVGPKAISEGTALAGGKKIVSGLRLDEPLRQAALKSKYFEKMLNKFKLSSGQYDVFTTGKDITGYLKGTIETFPEKGLKFKTARALGLTTEKTPISKKYTMKLIEDVDAKNLADNFALMYKKAGSEGIDEFSLVTRKTGKGLKEWDLPSYFDKDTGVGEAYSFSEAERLFPQTAIKDIRKTLGTTKLVTTSIDDVPIIDLMQGGYPLPGKITSVGITKDWVLEKPFRRYNLLKGKWPNAGEVTVFKDFPTKIEKAERLALRENIYLAGETTAPIEKTPFLRKIAENFKIVKPKTVPATIPFESQSLKFEATAKYFDESLLKPGDVLGKGIGELEGKVNIGFRDAPRKSIIFDKSVLRWEDYVETKKAVKSVGKTISKKIDSKMAENLLKEASGKGGSVSFQSAGGGLKTVTRTSAEKTKSVEQVMQTLAGGIGQITLPKATLTRNPLSVVGAGGIGTTIKSSGLIDVSQSIPTEVSQTIGQRTVMVTKPVAIEQNMARNLVKNVTITRPTTRLKSKEVQETAIKTSNKMMVAAKSNLDLVLKDVTKLKEVNVLKTKPVSKTRTDLIQEQINKLRIIPVTKVSTKLKTLTKQKTKTEVKTRFPPIVVPPIPPIVEIIIPHGGWWKRGKPSKMFSSMKKNLGFGLEVKRRGEWKPLYSGKVFTEKTAKGLGAKWAKKTLGASFRLVKKKGKVRSLPVSSFDARIFRKPIRKGKEQFGSNVFIQRAFARLSSKGEKKEIKKAKKDKAWAAKNLGF